MRPARHADGGASDRPRGHGVPVGGYEDHRGAAHRRGSADAHQSLYNWARMQEVWLDR